MKKTSSIIHKYEAKIIPPIPIYSSYTSYVLYFLYFLCLIYIELKKNYLQGVLTSSCEVSDTHIQMNMLLIYPVFEVFVLVLVYFL